MYYGARTRDCNQRRKIAPLSVQCVKVHLDITFVVSRGIAKKKRSERSVPLLLMPNVAVGAEHRARKSPSNAITVINMKRDLAR